MVYKMHISLTGTINFVLFEVEVYTYKMTDTKTRYQLSMRLEYKLTVNPCSLFHYSSRVHLLKQHKHIVYIIRAHLSTW